MKKIYYYTVTVNDVSTREFSSRAEAEEYRNDQIKRKLNRAPGALKPGDVIKVSDVQIKRWEVAE